MKVKSIGLKSALLNWPLNIWNIPSWNISWLAFSNVLYSEDNRERKHDGTRKRKYWIRLYKQTFLSSVCFFLFGSLDEPNTYQPIKHFHKRRPDNYGRMLSGELINIKRCILKGMSPLFKMLESGLLLFHGRTSTHLSCSPLTSIWRVLRVDIITEEPFYYGSFYVVSWLRFSRITAS